MANKFYWLKLKEDFFQQEAIEWLEEQKNGKEYSLFYLKLCLKSLKDNGVLVRKIGTKTIPYTAKKLGEVTNTSPNVAEQAIQLLKEIGLVGESEDGVFSITNIEEMVGTESSSREAVKKRTQRLRKKGQERDTHGDNLSPQCPCDVLDNGDNVSRQEGTDCPTEIRDKRLENREYLSSLSPLSCKPGQNVTDLYQQKIGLVDARVAEQLGDLLEQYGEEAVVKGINVAHERRARTIGYVVKCVENPIPEKPKTEWIDPFEAVFGKGGASNGSS